MAWLAAGGILVYVQSQRSSPLPGFASDPTPNLAGGSAAQRPSVLESSPPPAANPAASAAPARAFLPETALAPTTPDIFFPLPTLDADATVLNIFPADRPDPAAPLFPPTGELWTSSRFLESDRAGGDQRLAFSSKKPDEDEPLTLGLNNGSGIGPEYLLIKNEDTTFLGRVAGRYCEVHPGLSEEDRVSEVLFRCEFEHRLSRCNKLFSAVEYACDPADPGSRTLRTQAAWEVLLDPQETLSLRTAVLESSTYAPNREQTKTLDYTLDLSWKF